MASWRVSPNAVAGEWACFRQVAAGWPPLFHNAGVPSPDQESGRWHRKGHGYAQYLSRTPLGAWAECARYFSLRSETAAREMRRDLWLVFVREMRIADLSTFDHYDACGLDPRIAVGDHAAGQGLADELLAEGFRGVLSPSAALPGVTNLTVFGERYEHVLHSDSAAWRNPDVDSWLPVQPVAEAAPVPVSLCTETVFVSTPHRGYREWLAANGRPMPTSPP